MSNTTLLTAAAGLLAFSCAPAVSAQTFSLRARSLRHVDNTPPEDDDDRPAPARPKVRIANAQALARGRQFLAYGDARFRRQEFSEAFQRYRKAAEAAPNLAEAYFRQGLAQAALGRYLPAVDSIKRGMAIAPDWPAGEFRLSQLYGDSLAAKRAHLEQLALTAEEQPESAELMFLLGVELFFDGQPARAQTFLDRSAELGLQEELVRRFLEVAARQTRRRPKGEEL